MKRRAHSADLVGMRSGTAFLVLASAVALGLSLLSRPSDAADDRYCLGGVCKTSCARDVLR